MNPIENKNFFDNIYQSGDGKINSNPLAAPQKPFDINATEKAKNAQNNKKKEKKKDKNGKFIEEEDEDDDEKPLPRPMGL